MPHLKMGIARAGNVIGGGDWAQDRIVADCVRALAGGGIVEIRCPRATRPWQHVLEPLSGYLTLGQYLYEGLVDSGEAFNFGPRAEQTKSVLDLTHDIVKLWELDIEKHVKIMDEIPFNEAMLLQLNCDKALARLHWHSTLSYGQCIQMIVGWYRAYYENRTADMYQLTVEQIGEYVSEAKNQHQNWLN
jgi:CDP-glucose 4,6-dehydratase